MPELPEVEVVTRSLKKTIKNRKIIKITVNNRNLRFKLSKNFEHILKNKVIKNIERKSKYIVFYFGNHLYAILHLGMSGTLHITSKKNIKNLLLDQKIVSGIGNIYANEILYKSKISPMKSVRKLSSTDLIKIIKFSRITLKNAIKFGGSSIKDFKDISGGGGNFQTKFTVYNRENQKCAESKCKGIIQKRYISNRSTFICNFCQK